jgi:nucleotide-binding universal stress UspA family protein/quercetin dioxygenase-like cupin family protein
MTPSRTILHPTDFSECSRSAFEAACVLARSNGARLLVLHVMMPSASPVFTAPPHDPRRPDDSTTPFPWPQASDPAICVEHRVAEGDPAEEVLRLAEDEPCDLIVMGSHGRTGLGRLLTGSVAEQVLRRAAGPVMIVKTPVRPSPAPDAETTAGPGDVIDVRLLGPSLAAARTRKLLRTPGLEVVRLIVRAGQEIPAHTSRGEILVQCLEGRVGFTALGTTRELGPGDLIDVPAGEPHALKGIEEASLLLTALAPRLSP